MVNMSLAAVTATHTHSSVHTRNSFDDNEMHIIAMYSLSVEQYEAEAEAELLYQCSIRCFWSTQSTMAFSGLARMHAYIDVCRVSIPNRVLASENVF